MLMRPGISVIVALTSVAIVTPATAQIGKLKDKLKQKVEERVDQKKDAAGRKVDRGLDSALDAVECLITDQQCIKQAEAAGKPVKKVEGTAALKPGEGAWANYDFVPGERVLFFDDFTTETVGNFPRRMELVDGNGEVVEWPAGTGRRWLRFSSDSDRGGFTIPLEDNLPERYTIEFDVTIPKWGMSVYSLDRVGPGRKDDAKPVGFVTLSAYEVGIIRPSSRTGSVVDPKKAIPEFMKEGESNSRMFRVRLQVDGNYGKLYLDEQRVANIPNGNLGHANRVIFGIGVTKGDSGDEPILIGNISINAGGRKLYDALSTDGRIAVRGILFGTGSDRLRPESTPSLKEIGEMLKAHPDLKLVVEGHTDNVGDDAANQALSQKRAQAVAAFLIENFGIDAGRLQAKGLGETKPVGSNDTPEGRQQNRRVELVRQ
jgi:OmpA-OmpF porin, OOP family